MEVDMHPVVINMLGAMTDRYRAAKGNAPSVEIFKSWEMLAKKFADGDDAAWTEMSNILKELMHEWEANYNRLGQKVVELKIRKSQIESKADVIKYVSFSLQIVGLIIVLIKDLFK